MRKLIHTVRSLKLSLILEWLTTAVYIRYFPIMWRGRNIRNIHAMIKYLILPLATTDYDQRLM